MGSQNMACALSSISINTGESVWIIPLINNKKLIGYSEFNETESGCSILIQGHHMIGDYDLMPFNPAFLPIKGKYHEQGTLSDIEEDANTDYIEEYFGITIDEFCRIISGNMDEYQCKNHELISELSACYIHGEVIDNMINHRIRRYDKTAEQVYVQYMETINAKRECLDEFNNTNDNDDTLTETEKEDKRTEYAESNKRFWTRNEQIFTHKLFQTELNYAWSDYEKHKASIIEYDKFFCLLYKSNRVLMPQVNGSQCGEDEIGLRLSQVVGTILEERIIE